MGSRSRVRPRSRAESQPADVAKIENPHDKLFKWAFLQLGNARELLRTCLPATVVGHLDIDRIALTSANSVDDTLHERFSDLVHEIPYRGSTRCLYTILEHKSWPEPLALFDVAGYSLELMRAFRKGQREEDRRTRRPPLVIPVIVHHSTGGWTKPTRLHAIYDCPDEVRDAAVGMVLGIEPLIYDASGESDEKLRRRGMNPLATLVIWTLVHAAASKDIRGEIPAVYDLIRSVYHGAEWLDALRTIFLYIMDVCEITPGDVETILIEAIGRDAYEVYMTAAQVLREEGKAELRVEILLKQLQQRFGPLPQDVVARVSQARPDETERWIDRVIPAEALADVFAE